MKGALVTLVFLIAACSSASQVEHPKAVSSPSPVTIANADCADLFEKAMNSDSPVSGSFDCMSPGLQKLLANDAGIMNDATFAYYISQFPPSTVVPCGPMRSYDATHSVKLYLVKGEGGALYTDLVEVFVNDKTGRVVGVLTAGTSSGGSVKTTSAPTCDTKVNWPTALKYIE